MSRNKMMDYGDIRRLKPGDVVRHANGCAYIVTTVRGGLVFATRTIEVSNPQEWQVISRGDWAGLSELEREL